jgi:hypothetical protein
MMPPEILREQLAAERRRGVAFQIAWGRALRLALHGAAEKKTWADVIATTKRVWREAYLREGNTALAAFSDRTVGSGARLCKRPSCPRALPPDAKGYCSPECKREGEREREARAAAA